MATERQLTTLAESVFKRLRRRGLKLVLAESCTGGLVSAILTRVPGISEFHCGSAVVYQNATKIAWLGVSAKTLDRFGAVSEQTANEMACGALRRTPHADIAASITGHLGPQAPAGLDGVVYVAVARRKTGKAISTSLKKLELAQERGDAAIAADRRRLRRQRSAAAHVLRVLLQSLERDD